MQTGLLKRFFKLESSAGIILFLFAVSSMLWANSPWANLHQSFQKHGHFWVNDVLMSFFFLLVGLELKREFILGELRETSHIILPLMGAVGGMLVPAWIYNLFTYSEPTLVHAWAIPVATDIAFALGALTLFGKRVPLALKLFLMNLAIFDDIGAILIISLFFTTEINPLLLFCSALVITLLYFIKTRCQSMVVYLCLGALLWCLFFYAHVHPTLAGIFTALFIPIDSYPQQSLLHRLETFLQPWVTFLIMPLFALLNAGFNLEIVQFSTLQHPLVLGIVLGLCAGKPLGVLFALYIARKFILKTPIEFQLWQYLGLACLCGIGFTMSLFIGQLSFPANDSTMGLVKFAVLLASLLSAVIGCIILHAALPKPQTRHT